MMVSRRSCWAASLVLLGMTCRTLASIPWSSQYLAFVPPASHQVQYDRFESSPQTGRGSRALFLERGPHRAAPSMTSSPRPRRSVPIRSSVGHGAGIISAVSSAVVVFFASPGVAAAADATDGMGARLDAPAAISFGAVVVAFAFLQGRIRTASKARTARRDYEEVVKAIQRQQLAGVADEEDVERVNERMSQLLREEQEAKMVDLFGIPFNLVLPDGGGGGAGSTRGTGALSSGGRTNSGEAGGGNLGIREAMKAKADADMRQGEAREEEMTPAATLKVAALWLVLISQLWLLLVLWNDPMGPATSAFLRD